MAELHLDPTSRTPAVTFTSTEAVLVIAGESYPEDVTRFYTNLKSTLQAHFEEGHNSLRAELKLTYFNSSSARALMELLDMLDAQSEAGSDITVDWHVDPDDDITREFAEDIASDVSKLTVNLLDLTDDA